MLMSRIIRDYGKCYVEILVTHASPKFNTRKEVLFGVTKSGSGEPVYSSHSCTNAKKFAARYTVSPSHALGHVNRLSGDPDTHFWCLAAVSLLSKYNETGLFVSIRDLHDPDYDEFNPPDDQLFFADDIWVIGNSIIVVDAYKDSDDKEGTSSRLGIEHIRAVHPISESHFEFETYPGKVYSIFAL